ncbi:hypothetical protein [Nonomuraea sp. MG754425]|uniref:hypothetical protein n=1 Tax=Nonomuraea sp. MG754425 TaxID=2570319 RepID=UPI001F3F5548|nr:hypothetical protein [Nonomuraea sp. MG754425]
MAEAVGLAWQRARLPDGGTPTHSLRDGPMRPGRCTCTGLAAMAFWRQVMDEAAE